jgi:tRNA(fMet)-specific endonuclease VapC
MVCLDSSFVIDYLRGRLNAEEAYKKLQYEEDFFISTPTLMELISGAYQALKSEDEIKKIEEFIFSMIILDFDKESAFLAGKIEADLRKKGNIIDTEDIMIAAIAIKNEEILITKNKKHFERINGLKIESY